VSEWWLLLKCRVYILRVKRVITSQTWYSQKDNTLWDFALQTHKWVSCYTMNEQVEQVFTYYSFDNSSKTKTSLFNLGFFALPFNTSQTKLTSFSLSNQSKRVLLYMVLYLFRITAPIFSLYIIMHTYNIWYYMLKQNIKILGFVSSAN
jgi:hypothetical protein